MPRKSKPTGDYAVGYGRPPEHTRFQAGRSGNPKGRPKGARDLKTALEDALKKEFSQRVTAVEGGKPRTVSKLELILINNVNKAAKGDARALRELLTIAHRLGLLEGTAPVAVLEVAQRFTAEDQAIIDRFLTRERTKDPNPDADSGANEKPDNTADEEADAA